jgi:hypothetical protein
LQDRGPSRNFTVRWFFDMDYGGCARYKLVHFGTLIFGTKAKNINTVYVPVSFSKIIAHSLKILAMLPVICILGKVSVPVVF